MTNHRGEIDTTGRKTLDQRHPFLECVEIPPLEFFRDRQATSSVESEVFEVDWSNRSRRAFQTTGAIGLGTEGTNRWPA
jgi:hypothetical protein